MMTLFDRDHIVGIFRGFSEGGMEFHADIVMPYRDDFQASPMHGQFVLVQLEHEQEAVFGRVTSIAAQGRLVSSIGEDYAVRAVRDQRPIPDELRDQYLKYKVNIRILGVYRREGDKLLFVPSHRRLPHVGAPVAFLSDELLADVANANDDAVDAAEIGFLAFGEFVYCGDDPRAAADPGFVAKSPAIIPRFQISKLVARRSFVFARAGFGKSNLVKLLFASLYATDPKVPRRNGTEVPVGTVIFDPDGEYFWPDHHGRPALCDVDGLRDRLVVFTNRRAPSDTYQSFVVDGVKLDIRRLAPSRVLGIALSPEKQDQQNVAKLKGLPPDKWRVLVNLIYKDKYQADPGTVRQLLGLQPNEEAQTSAAIGHMTRVVRELHDPTSQLLAALRQALADGKLCVVDISQMRGPQGLQLAGIILNDIFEHNQERFTDANPKTIPTIAVVEEAQSMLGGSGQREDGPFVAWVKEGRKYDLGAVLITQQPGSIPGELLSQGDNFFVFHLLAQGDLYALKRANAHFSDDLLSALLNEPLVGHGIFWSSAPGTDRHARPYPLSVRVLDFNKAHALRDPTYEGPALGNYAAALRRQLAEEVKKAKAAAAVTDAAVPDAAVPDAAVPDAAVTEQNASVNGDVTDVDATYRNAAINQLRSSTEFWANMRGGGTWWWRLGQMLKQFAPSEQAVGDRFTWSLQLVPQALNELLGEGRWISESREYKGAPKQWVKPAGPIPGVDQAPPDDKPPF
jgi:Helicase HerA, central domain